jgi:hypothetical protein
MRVLLILIIGLLGVGTGLGLTAFLVGPGASFVVRDIGGWLFPARIGAADIDPYTRAWLFHEGGLPLAAGEGYALRTGQDSDGVPLDSGCRYRLTGPFPAARYWTITLVDGRGRLVPNLAERTGFTSSEILRTQEGPFSIEIGPDPLAGNWLPTGRRSATFQILLRFYETPLAATATALEARALPALRKADCAP